MVWEIEVYAEIDGSIFRNTCSVTIHPLVQLCGSVAYILFFTFSARDKIDEIGICARGRKTNRVSSSRDSAGEEWTTIEVGASTAPGVVAGFDCGWFWVVS